MTDIAPLVLVDGSSYLFRAFHALPPLVSTKGQPTGAIKGVINMIRSLIRQYPDSPIAVIFDAKGKTFRNDIYSEYKAHRPPMPDDLRSQIAPIHDIIRAMGLPLLAVEGVEADDVIGTLAQQAWEQKIPTLISTGDKDMAQLVNEHVTLLNTMNDEKLDIAGVESKFGLRPDRIIDYLALMGDKADNIPGVPSVGAKTAVKWLLEYDSVSNVIEQADAITGKVGEKLRDNIEQLKMSYDLATIKLDVDLEFGPKDLVHMPEEKESLLTLFLEYEFKSWVKELSAEGISLPQGEQRHKQAQSKDDDNEQSDAESSEPDVLLTTEQIQLSHISTEDELKALVAQCEGADCVALSLESDGEHYKDAHIVGLSISTEMGKATYIPLRHDAIDVAPQLDSTLVLTSIKPVIENRAIPKAGHDLKRINHLLLSQGIKLQGGRYDTMLQSYVLNSVAQKHMLEKVAQNYLGQELVSLEELLGKGRNKLAYSQTDIDKAMVFSAGNADAVFRLAQLLGHKLQHTGELLDVYKQFEISLMPVLTRMEQWGVRVDVKALATQSAYLAERIEALSKAAFEAADEEFNLDSPKQLQKIFYEKLDYPVLKKTPKGQPSTAEPILQELAHDHELPKVILEYRGLRKLKSTYTDKLPEDINPQTQRIHSSFQQAVAATGRLSSTDPNLQNIPIRTEEGRRIRQAFTPAEGYVLLAADYSQVELRIMAHLSEDEGLLEAFSSGQDVHKATAAEIFGVDASEVNQDQRRSAKAINFGLIYGMSAFGLAKQLGIARGEAQAYVERYFERYPGVQRYMETTRMLATEQGYVETVFGRRLYLPDIKASNGMLRKAAERTAINAPMQGTAADIIKHAMVDIDQWLSVANLDARLVLQVHDELVFEVKEKDLPLLKEGVQFRMMSAASLQVPLIVDMGVGVNWDQAH